MTMEAVLLFWEAYFIEGDPLLVLWVVVAVLVEYRERLYNVDQSLLPQTLAGIVIASVEEVKAIFKKYDTITHYYYYFKSDPAARFNPVHLHRVHHEVPDLRQVR